MRIKARPKVWRWLYQNRCFFPGSGWYSLVRTSDHDCEHFVCTGWKANLSGLSVIVWMLKPKRRPTV